ncbi:MAG: glycoside hydrolase, partial [candidate division KSB1 bacterium]|nr:glycoside hydrolase [candidate division KSB1 bacterium]
VLGLIVLAAWPTAAQDLRREMDLAGHWKLEIGDNPAYRDPDFDDSHWETIEVPEEWEDEGFPGYDGLAWYRIRVRIPARLAGRPLYLRLGRVDDVDETFFNGHRIGGLGSFPPNYQTAWDQERIYPLPESIIRFGKENVIAVRVFDAGGKGGITQGPIGIYSRVDLLKLAIDLSGTWRFRPGDDTCWARPGLDDTRWDEIRVPSYWEKEGYPDLDGYAWYRKTVVIPKDLAASKLILVLGYVNDADETYFNGRLIGHTGRFPRGEQSPEGKKDEERAYFIPPFVVRPGRENVIAVRVFDIGKYGGIYRGYVGIATREEYLQYSERRKKER